MCNFYTFLFLDGALALLCHSGCVQTAGAHNQRSKYSYGNTLGAQRESNTADDHECGTEDTQFQVRW